MEVIIRVRVRVRFGVFGFFTGDGGERRGRWGSDGLESGGGRREMNVGDSVGRFEPAMSPEIVFDLLLGSPVPVKFLGVCVVPPRKADFCGCGIGGGGGGNWRENWKWD